MILTATALFVAVQSAEPQVDCDNAMTQTEMNICAWQSYQRADAELNEVWKQAADKAKQGDRDAANYDGPTDAFANLLAAQRAWLTFRDAHCLAENGKRENSGTIWPLLQNSCLEALTQHRTDQLRSYLEMPY
jgi:uncharacterized protein YecT (DUF1311 family)